MRKADRIWSDANTTLERWGLKCIPFSESATNDPRSMMGQVFTGRESELTQVLTLFKGADRKRILVYGSLGIGKTAFILEILGVIWRNAEDILPAYISLPKDMDLGKAALIALAREMKGEDELAKHILNQMGLANQPSLFKRKNKFKADFKVLGTEVENEEVLMNPSQYPDIAFENLLSRALETYRNVVIAIDDIDKRDPARVRELLQDAQGMLKGRSSFILTGHPSGLTRELLTSSMGLFDLSLKLEPLDLDTTYQMLIDYLDSVRVEIIEDQENGQSDDGLSVYPFVPQAAQTLCKKSYGVPRWLNRLGSYVLLKACNQKADMIDDDMLEQGLRFADEKLRHQSLSPEDMYIFELVLRKGVLSDSGVTIEELEALKANTFREILPNLDRLVQLDLLQRLPSERDAMYTLTPIILGKDEKH